MISTNSVNRFGKTEIPSRPGFEPECEMCVRRALADGSRPASLLARVLTTTTTTRKEG